jgi:hypothetical protein
MTNTIKIGNRSYSIESTCTKENLAGEIVRYTDLKGARGADVTLIETATSATLIHFGRMKPAERLPLAAIKRA